MAIYKSLEIILENFIKPLLIGVHSVDTFKCVLK